MLRHSDLLYWTIFYVCGVLSTLYAMAALGKL